MSFRDDDRRRRTTTTRVDRRDDATRSVRSSRVAASSRARGVGRRATRTPPGDARGWVVSDGRLDKIRTMRDDGAARRRDARRRRRPSESSSDSSSSESTTRRSSEREVLGRGRTSVVTATRAPGRLVAVKRVRVDDDAVAAQVRVEMRVLSRAMRRARGKARCEREAEVRSTTSSSGLTAAVKDEDKDGGCGSDDDDDDHFARSTMRATEENDDDKDVDKDAADGGYDGIVECLGFGFNDVSNAACIRLEMMTTGSLEDVARRGGRLDSSPRAALCVVRCLTNALSFLHDTLRVVHRDVKPSNVLLDDDGACKLCDFGLCAPADAASSPTRRLDGTVLYMSPERLASSDARCGPESDVWGVGVTVLESASGRAPFDVADGGPLGLVVQIVESVIDVDACLPDDSDDDTRVLRRVVSACLRKDYRERVTVQELRNPRDARWDLSAYTRADVRKFLRALPASGDARPWSPSPSCASDEDDVSGFSSFQW